jgi:hypothetical protein
MIKDKVSIDGALVTSADIGSRNGVFQGIDKKYSDQDVIVVDGHSTDIHQLTPVWCRLALRHALKAGPSLAGHSSVATIPHELNAECA